MKDETKSDTCEVPVSSFNLHTSYLNQSPNHNWRCLIGGLLKHRCCPDMKTFKTSFLCGAAFLFVLTTHAAPAKISVAADKPGHKVPPTLWGIFFEDINLSADGG